MASITGGAGRRTEATAVDSGGHEILSCWRNYAVVRDDGGNHGIIDTDTNAVIVGIEYGFIGKINADGEVFTSWGGYEYSYHINFSAGEYRKYEDVGGVGAYEVMGTLTEPPTRKR